MLEVAKRAAKIPAIIYKSLMQVLSKPQFTRKEEEMAEQIAREILAHKPLKKNLYLDEIKAPSRQDIH